jgi:RimJ/RimL family protein N-acetyltransferase
VNPVTTQRLSLHPVTMADLDEFLALHAVEDRPRSVEALTELLRDFCAVWAAGEHGYWRIVFDGRTAGFGGVKPKTWRDRPVWNLYYRIRPELQGKGLATEMARKAISVAGELHPDWPVLVETRPDNVASIRLAEGLGMTRHPDADGWAVFLLEN